MLWGCILPVADRISPLHLAGGSCCPPGIMSNPSGPTRSHAASPTKYSAPKGLSSRRSEPPVVYLEIYTQGFHSKGWVQSATFSGFFTKLFPRKLQIQTIYPSTSAIFLNLNLFSQFLKTTFEPSGLPLTPKAPFPRPLSTSSAKIRCRPVPPVIFLFRTRCVWNGKILCIWHSNIYISKSRLEIGHQSFKQEYLKTSRTNSLRWSLPAIAHFTNQARWPVFENGIGIVIFILQFKLLSIGASLVRPARRGNKPESKGPNHKIDIGGTHLSSLKVLTNNSVIFFRRVGGGSEVVTQRDFFPPPPWFPPSNRTHAQSVRPLFQTLIRICWGSISDPENRPQATVAFDSSSFLDPQTLR